MKKFFLSFLSFMGLAFSALAQSHINIELLGATYTTPAVQFRVSWNNIPVVAGETHNAKVWLWVDFIEIKNNQPSGSWTRASVANPSPGIVAPETNKGFWLQGNTGAYNQTVTVALTNILPNTTFNWCAYASDCPPNVTAMNGIYTFRGSPPFTLIDVSGTNTQKITGTTLAASALTITPTTIMDETACPGIFCPYQGSDLYIDATHLCQQRTSGAKNWEAWIKDPRDNELYRMVLMPDNKWWLADNIRYTKGNTIGRCSNDDAARCATPCGRWYNPTEILDASVWSTANPSATRGICPVNWHIPSEAETKAMLSSLSETTDKDRLIALKTNNTIAPLWTTSGHTGVLAGSDSYGFSIYPCGHAASTSRWTTDGYYKHADGKCYRMFFVERDPKTYPCMVYERGPACDNDTPVRCTRY